MKMKTRNRCILNTFWFYFWRHFGSMLEAFGSILATFWHPKTELKSRSIFVQNLKVAGASLTVQGCPGSPARASEGACRSVRGCLPERLGVPAGASGAAWGVPRRDSMGIWGACRVGGRLPDRPGACQCVLECLLDRPGFPQAVFRTASVVKRCG